MIKQKQTIWNLSDEIETADVTSIVQENTARLRRNGIKGKNTSPPVHKKQT